MVSYVVINLMLPFLFCVHAHMGEMRNAHRILVGKLEGKRPFRILGLDVRNGSQGNMLKSCGLDASVSG
jgi:hypothetical protein